MNYKFTIVITQENKWYIARSVELGVVSQGKTVEKAQENVREAIELYLEDNPNFKNHVPKKSPFVTTLEVQYA